MFNVNDVVLFFDYILEDFIKLEIIKREKLDGELHYYARVVDRGIVSYTYSKTGGVYPRRLDEYELYKTKEDAIKGTILDIENELNELKNDLTNYINQIKDINNAIKDNERLLNKLEGKVERKRLKSNERKNNC